MSEHDERPTDDLMNDGLAALREERYDDALAVAAVLRERRFSGSFEIAARAHWANGEHDRAIEVLEDGVAKAPGAAPLWHWLACYRSDMGNYPAALDAFEKEAEFEHVAASLTTYNIAVVHERMEQYAQAIGVIDRLERPDDDGPSPGDFAELRARLLLALDRIDDAIVAADEAVEWFGRHSRSEDDGDDDAEAHPDARRRDMTTRSRAYATRAAARSRLGERSAALEDVDLAIIHGAGGGNGIPSRVYDVLRDLDAATSPAAQLFRVLVKGLLVEDEEDDAPLGFYLPMQIIADDVAEALGYALRFVPEPSRPGAEIAEAEIIEPAADALKGVVFCGPFSTWDPIAADDAGEG